MDEITITNAQYYTLGEGNEGIKATINGEIICVPLSEGNRHYDEIMRQVEAGTLTIADAE